MLSNAIIGATLLIGSSIASPTSLFARNNGPDACSDNITGDDGGISCYVYDIGYYSDSSCTEPVEDKPYNCEYTNIGYDTSRCDLKPASGVGSCASGNLPAQAPYYAMVKDGSDPALQILFTEDQSCPPSGPGAVFAVLENNKKCVEISVGGASPGVSFYPTGGSGLTRRGNVTHWTRDLEKLEAPAVKKRDGPKCKGFTTKSQQTSESASYQVSDIIDCTNGGDAGCSITEGSEHSTSITTSYSATAGGGIEGIFEASATFGMDFTDEESTSVQTTYSVQAGQKGYLSAYCAATEFTGTFTDCDDGQEHDGETLALKANGMTYVVINTGA